MTDTTELPQPCGSWRSTEEYEGMSRASVWCSRTAGPCPYPGTREAGDRSCAGPRVMKVVYGDDVIERARRHLTELAEKINDPTRGQDGVPFGSSRDLEALSVAVSAIDACTVEGTSGARGA